MKSTDCNRRVGENLKQLRVMMGMSVAEFSEKLDISQDAVYKMERGDLRVSIEFKHKCAKILGCSPQTFEDGLGLEDGETQPPLKYPLKKIDQTTRLILRKLSSEWDGNIKALMIFMGMVAAFPPEERREIYMQGILARDRLLADEKIRQEDLPPEMEYMEGQLGGLY